MPEHRPSLSDYWKNTCVIPKFMFPLIGSRETLHSEAHSVKNEGRLIGEFSPVVTQLWVVNPLRVGRRTEKCQQVSLKTKLFTEYKLYLEDLTAANGGRDVMGSCICMAFLLDSSILYGKKKLTLFYYVESKSFLNLVFTTWIICFKQSFLHVVCQGAGAQEVQCVPLKVGGMKLYTISRLQPGPVGKANIKSLKRQL